MSCGPCLGKPTACCGSTLAAAAVGFGARCDGWRRWLGQHGAKADKACSSEGGW